MSTTLSVSNSTTSRITTRSSTTNLKSGVYDENVVPTGMITKSSLATKPPVAIAKPTTTVANVPAKRTTLGDISNVTLQVDAKKAVKVEASKPSLLPTTRRVPLQAKPATTAPLTSVAVPAAKPPALAPSLPAANKPKINTTSSTTVSAIAQLVGYSFLDSKSNILNNHQAQQPPEDEIVLSDEEAEEEEEPLDEDDINVQNQNMSVTSGVTNIEVDAMEIEAHSKPHADYKQLSIDSIVDDEVEDIDECDQEDPQFCTEYVTHIFEYLRQKEVRDAVNPRYMDKQSDIVEKHRTILVDWMAEVAVKFKLLTETMFLAINLVDRFLQHKAVARQKLQLVGITAMLVASKYEEIYTPEVRDFIWITAKAYTQEDVLKMERLMLVTLDFNLATPTPLHFLRRFSKAARSDSKIHTLSKYLIELSLMEYKLMQYLPSVIAAASVYISRKMCKITPLWNSTLEFHTGYTAQEIMPCVRELNDVVKKQNLSKYKSIYKKYASPKLLSVATLPVCEDL